MVTVIDFESLFCENDLGNEAMQIFNREVIDFNTKGYPHFLSSTTLRFYFLWCCLQLKNKKITKYNQIKKVKQTKNSDLFFLLEKIAKKNNGNCKPERSVFCC